MDASNDYFGLEQANGKPQVGVNTFGRELTRGGTHQWKALNAAYLLRRVELLGGILVLEPGVELLMEEGGEIIVRGNGILRAMGTATDPVIIHGEIATPGHWNGIKFDETNFDTHILQHTTVSHSGRISGLLDFRAAVWVDNSEVTFANSTFSDNAGFGIRCSESSIPSDADSVLNDDGGNIFSNNGSGSLSDNCVIR